MKRVFLIIAAVLLTLTICAQSPQKMSFQAVIRNSADQLVTNHAIGIRISILLGTTPVYVETHATTANANGLVTIEIGSGTFVSGVAFSAIDWAAGEYSIKTETDPTGGTNYTAIVGISQLLSVPYALYSNTVAGYPETDPAVKAINGIVKSNGTNISAAIASDFPTLNQNTTGNAATATTAGTVTTAAQPAITSVGTLTGLTVNGTTTVITPVNANDAANKEYVDALKSQIEELQIAVGLYKVKDIDENVYKTVTIGTQLWMAENLRTTKYNDGTTIPNITLDATWAALTTGAYSDYSNTPANSTSYGRLYNWYSLDNNAATKVASNGGKNVCPTGWHIPTDEEWTTLTDYLTAHGYGYEGSGSDIAKSMASISGWTAHGTPGYVGNDQASNNSSRFTALPGGYRTITGSFGGIGSICIWWSSSENSAADAPDREMSFDAGVVDSFNDGKPCGFSVRCLRD